MLVCLSRCWPPAFYWIKQLDMTTYGNVGDLEGICLVLLQHSFYSKKKGLIFDTCSELNLIPWKWISARCCELCLVYFYLPIPRKAVRHCSHKGHKYGMLREGELTYRMHLQYHSLRLCAKISSIFYRRQSLYTPKAWFCSLQHC